MPKIEDLQKQVTSPGIYFKMSKEIYHNDKSLSNSGMGYLAKTPKSYWHISPMNPNRDKLDKASFASGRVLHTLLLEPHKFHDEWQIKPGVKKSTVPGMIGEGEYNELKTAVAALREDKIISSLFSHGYPEVSIFWVDEETGVPCRVCIDYLSPFLTADLKSTRDISDYSIGYSITDYGYHRQDALYKRGLAEVKKLIKSGNAIVEDCPDETWLAKFLETVHDKFAFVWQEKEPPFLTRADELCERTSELGAVKYREACHVFKENYELYGEAPWPSGYEGRVGLIQVDELPQKINY